MATLTGTNATRKSATARSGIEEEVLEAHERLGHLLGLRVVGHQHSEDQRPKVSLQLHELEELGPGNGHHDTEQQEELSVTGTLHEPLQRVAPWDQREQPEGPG
jgi:hypothetical protein